MDSQSKTSLSWRSRMVAESAGIRVVEDPAATAFSISRAGVLSIPAVHTSDPDFNALVAGGTLHEALHFAESQFSVLDECTPIERNFMMAFEDMRIESLGCRRFAGAKAELCAMWAAFYRRGQVSRPDPDDDDILYAVGAYALAFCRRETLGLAPSAQDVQTGRQVLLRLLDPETVAEIDATLALAHSMTSTADALELGRRLLVPFVNPEDLEKVEPRIAGTSDDFKGADAQPNDAHGQQRTEPPPDARGLSSRPEDRRDSAVDQQQASSRSEQSSREQGAANEEDQAGTAAGDPQTASDALAHEPGSTAQQGRGAAEHEQGQDACPGDARGVASKIEHRSPSVKARMSRDLNTDAGDLASEAIDGIVTAAVAGGEHNVRIAVERFDDAQAVVAEDLLEAAIANTMALRARLRRTLRAGTQEKSRFATSGSVVPTRLWKLRTGDTRVFQQWSEAVQYSTLVYFLIDRSESMEGRKLRLALEAGCATSYALEGFPGVTTMAGAFPGADSAVVNLKGHRERTNVAAGRMAGLNAWGGTPLAQAMDACRVAMLKVPAERRILLVGTDGRPASKERARQSAHALQSVGIEVLLVGIASDASGLGADAIRIASVDELAQTLADHLERRFAQIVKQAA